MEAQNEQLRYIDLFCGIGGFHIAMSSFGHKCILACDIDKDCMEVYKDNFGIQPVNDITKIKESEIEDFDVLCGGFPCFVKRTPVLTDLGYKNIEDVQHDDMLMTHTGAFHKILNKQFKIYNGNLHTIKCMYIPECIQCTEEHPFLVRQLTHKIENRNKHLVFGEQEWKTSKDIDTNSFIGIPINNQSIIPQFTSIKKLNQYQSKEEITIIDKDYQWFMIGYFLGDGWIQDDKRTDGRLLYKIHFVIANNQIDIIKPILEKTFKLTFKENSGGCTKFVCSNQSWWEVLNSVGRYAHGKRIPPWIENAPKELLKELINGYASADGNFINYKGTGSYKIETTSQNLALGVQRILLKIGIISSVNKMTRPKNCIIQGRVCNQRDTFTIRWYPNKSKKYLSFIEDKYAWLRVKSNFVHHVENEPVYNFEVDCDNSYVVNNLCVHNCQAFSHSGKQKGFEDTRGTLFYDICRILREKQPKYFILENVKNLKTHNKGNTWNTIYNSLVDLGYETYKTPIVLSPHHIGIPQNRERVFIVGVKQGQGVLKPFPSFTKKQSDIKSIIQSDNEVEQTLLKKVQINTDDESVIEIWNKLVEYFSSKQLQLPGFPLWTDDWDSDYSIDDLPEWKQKFITKNREFYNTHLSFLQSWLLEARNTPSFTGAKKKLEWQAGKLNEDSMIWNYIFQLRPSGIRVKRKDYFPALVAMAQIPFIGENKRKLTPRETARLQSFPEDFKIHKTPSKAYKQFGNSVNVEVVKMIIKHLIY